MFFPNGQHIIDASIIQAGDILDSIIINNGITISEMTAVQLLALLLEYKEFLRKLNKELIMIYSNQQSER